MHKVLIVDDEPFIRTAIKSLCNWQDYGFSIDYEASNGRQALDLIRENPEIAIVITDINMPVMDGLQFISEIGKLDRKIETYVLSAYNDYKLVREAFKIGARDYIIKTELDKDIILKLLLESSARMDNVITSDINFDNRYENEKDLNYLKEMLLKDLIGGNNIDTLEKRISQFKLRIGKRNSGLYFICVDDYDLITQKYSSNSLNTFSISVVSTIYMALSTINRGEALSISPQDFVVCISFDDMVSASHIQTEFNNIAMTIKQFLWDYLSLSVTIGVSSILDGYANFPRLLGESEFNARLRFILGKGKIIFPKSVELMNRNSNYEKEEIGTKLTDLLREADRELVFNKLEVLFSSIRRKGILNIDKIYAEYLQILFEIMFFIHDAGKSAEEIFGEDINFLEKIKKYETMDEIEIWVKNVTDWVIDYFHSEKNVKVNRVVEKGMEFIKTNYYEDLTLKMVSDRVGLSESHFSRIFIKHTGKSFTDFLTFIRIEKAKVLMSTTDMKIYEIAAEVGYSNTEHFSRMFKKITGCSPNNFRK